MTDSVAQRDQTSVALAKVRALMGGTEAMRKAKKTYLPKEPLEDEKAYEARLARTTLFNGFRKTVTDMLGKVFAQPIALGEDVDPELAAWSENIDLMGRALNNFAHDVLNDAMQAGISFVFVDSPSRAPGETRATRRRPYMVHVRAEDLLGVRYEDIDGQIVLTQVRMMEVEQERDPEDEFKATKVEQVRVLDLLEPVAGRRRVQVRLYRKAGDGEMKGRWVLFGEPRLTDLPEITLVPVYARRTGYMKGEPPLEDLADANIAHWQSSSDQRNILHVARVPLLFGAGFDKALDAEGNVVEISVQSMTTVQNPQASLRWVEHSGAAIGAGMDDLKALEFQMQMYGLELLVSSNSGDTATGEIIDQAKMNSPLAMIADNLEDALEQAMIYMALHAGKPAAAAGSISVNKDFGISALTQFELTALLQMAATGLISHAQFIEEMTRRGVLKDGVTAEQMRDEAADEAGSGLADDGLGE